MTGETAMEKISRRAALGSVAASAFVGLGLEKAGAENLDPPSPSTPHEVYRRVLVVLVGPFLDQAPVLA